MSAARRLAVAVVLLLVGAATAVATVALHGWWWGFAFGAAATLLVAYALPAGWWTRLPYAVGWDAMVGWLTFPRPEGDYLLSADVQGYAVLALGLALLAGCVGTLPRPGGAEERPGVTAGAGGYGTGR
jgi:hypothetical protein